MKKTKLYAKHYATYEGFRAAIDDCLNKITTDHRKELATLMTHNFQTFHDVSLLAA